MPIKIPNELPAVRTLTEENIFVMTEMRAITQDIRPLKLLILNLMPTKVDTETQLSRLLGNSPLQVEIELMHTRTHVSRNTAEEHMLAFYQTFEDVRSRNFDGMIITGAPVELLPFEEVEYWDELCEIMEWTKTHVHSTFHICWGAQAGLYYHYGLQKHPLPEKMFGIFEHQPLDLLHPLMRGLDETYYVPHSRHTEIRMDEIVKIKDLQVLSYSPVSGVHLLSDMECRNFYSTGHSEYDADTLAREYFRDKEKGLPIKIPYNYFPDDDVTRTPVMKWRSTGVLLFTNWLNYFVYQRTPYDLANL